MSAAIALSPLTPRERTPLRVLHVYAGNRFGGIERLLLTLAQSEAQHGMRSRFALCFDGLLARQLCASGAAVDLLGEVRVRYPWTVQQARRRLDAILERERFDVVLFHACWPLALFAPVAKARKTPFVYWSHDAPQGRHWIERWAGRRSPDLVIANSQYTARNVSELFSGAAQEIVHYPSPVRFADPGRVIRRMVRASLGISDDQVAIVIAARVEARKGHLVLAEALGRLRDLPRWVLLMAGGVTSPAEHDYLHKVLAKIRKAGLAERVHYLGHRDDVPNLLVASDIFCQPNTGPEPFGLSFIEALDAGLPVVTSALGGALEIVDESCGVLVAPGDSAALAVELATLVDDNGRRARLGAAGATRARALCDVATQLDRLRCVLERLRGGDA